MKDDCGLVYLREARNSVEHGLEPVADVREARAQVWPFFEGGGSARVSISNCNVNGIPMNGFAEIAQGRVVASAGNLSIRELPASVTLKKVENPEKRVTIDVPTNICGKSLPSISPIDLVKVANEVLAELHQEFKGH